MAKVLSNNLQNVNSDKQLLSNTIKETNKDVQDAMGSLSKIVTEIVDSIEKENTSDEGIGKIKFCPTPCWFSNWSTSL